MQGAIELAEALRLLAGLGIDGVYLYSKPQAGLVAINRYFAYGKRFDFNPLCRRKGILQAFSVGRQIGRLGAPQADQVVQILLFISGKKFLGEGAKARFVL